MTEKQYEVLMARLTKLEATLEALSVCVVANTPVTTVDSILESKEGHDRANAFRELVTGFHRSIDESVKNRLKSQQKRKGYGRLKEAGK